MIHPLLNEDQHVLLICRSSQRPSVQTFVFLTFPMLFVNTQQEKELGSPYLPTKFDNFCVLKSKN
jgi:hypothetical protein